MNRIKGEIAEMWKRTKIFGMNLDCSTYDRTVLEIEKRIDSSTKTQHVVLNASKVVLAHKDKKLKEIINSAGIVNADGQSIVWALKFLGLPKSERVTGVDLFERLLKVSEKKGYRVYFLGATDEVLTKMEEKILIDYPRLNISGKRNGFFDSTQESKIIHDINQKEIDILFLGMPSPKKEYWVAQNYEILNSKFIMGVGGTFDIYGGKTERAPLFFQNNGLEWFYRFIQEPKRMFKRYLVGNLQFAFILTIERLKMYKKG